MQENVPRHGRSEGPWEDDPDFDWDRYRERLLNREDVTDDKLPMSEYDRRELIQRTHLNANILISRKPPFELNMFDYYAQTILGLLIAALAFATCIIFADASTGTMQNVYLPMGLIIITACAGIAVIQFFDLRQMRREVSRTLWELHQVKKLVESTNDSELWDDHVLLTFDLERLANRSVPALSAHSRQTRQRFRTHNGTIL